ncbi:hypothetical protein BKA82DRAFT_25835 [Pisolithus tinctorius]|uniref:Uncharacterized protein n=1 Tax=Pisolithus tinctorius Marx 270 TaxID=870435 RepID=A0A0C3PAS2_PISTI|nr:hypothetical protein BKA82DRAFT_25835 [Pisolithus tinctorius]KIO04719.1 hypothetical protein M404DRAFT_25835 [Pisolithus tinctorius Marx 270]
MAKLKVNTEFSLLGIARSRKLALIVKILWLQHGRIMDELAQARAELARLQSTERMLFKDPLAVCVAVETQSRKISELANAQPSQIKRLPVELLTRTFSFLLARGREDPYIFFHCLPMRRNDLAGVSRLWRDLILDTPSFWRDD